MNKAASFFIVATGTVVTLIYGKHLLIPFIFALLLWFLIRSIRHLLNRSQVFRDKLPSWSKNLISSAVILCVLVLTAKVLTNSVETLTSSYPQYEPNVEHIMDEVNEATGMDVGQFVNDHIMDFDFGGILSTAVNSITDMLGNVFIIIIYVIFIFLEEAYFRTKLHHALDTSGRTGTVVDIIKEAEVSISHYVGLKTLVGLISASLSYITLLFIGVDAPAFWAFTIFVLSFIPFIGPLVATVFPAIFCLIQFGEFTPCFIVLGCIGTIVVVMGNVVEPKLMGNSLNVSPLVVIISLAIWGTLWGITGMILSVPIAVILVIIFSHFEQTKNIAIMLSEKGDIGTKAS